MKKYLSPHVVFLGAFLCSAPMGTGEVLRVWDFDRGILTDQGGFYNQYQAGDSRASIRMTDAVRRGSGGRSMEVAYTKAASGYCGVWLHLFDETADPDTRRYLDVSRHPFLSFWARTAEGEADFVVQMADAEWVKKEDSRAAGPLSKYLGRPADTNWREVVIPYEEFNLMTDDAGGITFNFADEGSGTVYIDDVCFKLKADTLVPESPADAAAAASAKPLRAMWVWKTNPLLLDDGYRAEFFAFCDAHDIGELFLQLPYRFLNDMTEQVECEIEHPQELGAFLAAARARGILCHALDGYPEFALRAQHPRVLALVRAVLAFNDAAAPEQRFHGIHLDNEPYQLLGFEGPRREEILAQYLEVNEKAMQLVRDHGGDVVYGVDIPFWFDEDTTDEESMSCVVTFRGQRKIAAAHIIDICDNVGIMAYRNFAGGADGVIRHSRTEIDHAEHAGKKVYIGLETFRYDPIPVAFLYGMSEGDWRGLEGGTNGVLLTSTVDGFHVRTLYAGGMRLVGLARDAEGRDEAAFRRALQQLASTCGLATRAAGMDVESVQREAEAAIQRSDRFDGFEPLVWDEPAVPGFLTTERMLEKITFAGKTRRDLEAAMEETAAAFADRESFLGFAIHYYDTYRRMEE